MTFKVDAHLLAGVRRLDDWPWSGYRQIAGIGSVGGFDLCDASVALGLFGSRKEFVRFHEDETMVDDPCRVIGRRPRLDDHEARSVACRQIERLTGIGRNVIARAK